MNFNPLDNHGWYALNSHHRHPVIRGKIAAHYPQDVLFGAVLPEYNQTAFNDLRNIVVFDETIGFILESLPDDLNGFCEISAVCTHPDYRGRGYGGP